MNQCEYCGEPLAHQIVDGIIPQSPAAYLPCPVCFGQSPVERRNLRLLWEIREYLRRLVEKE